MMIFTSSFAPFANLLSNEQAGKLLFALYHYHLNGEIAELDEPLVLAAFGVLRQGIDASHEGYQAKLAASQYGAFCRREKAAGREPLTREEWEQATEQPQQKENIEQLRKAFHDRLNSTPPTIANPLGDQW